MATKTVINTITTRTTTSSVPLLKQQQQNSGGISIIIDQDQLQPQQQVVNCKQQQQLEAAKITIYQKNNNCTMPTTRTEISRMQPQHQPMSPNATTTTATTTTTTATATQNLKTFIDINRNNNNDVVSAGNTAGTGVGDNDVVVGVDKKKCGEFLHVDGNKTATFIKETGYTTTAFPQLLLLKVASSNGDSNNSTNNLDNNKNEPLTTTTMASERGKFTAKVVAEKEVEIVVGADEKAKEANLLLAGKSQVNTNVDVGAVAGNGVSNGCAGISITHEYSESNSNNGIDIGNNDEVASKQKQQKQRNKMMIIQCNNTNSPTNETKYLNNADVKYSNNYDNGVDGNDEEADNDPTKHNEESHRRGRLHFNSISANSLNSSGGVGNDSSRFTSIGIGDGENGQNTFGQQQAQQSQQKQLENVYATNAHSSLTTKAVDCASALTETVRSADKKLDWTTADSSSAAAATATNSTHVVKIQIKPNGSGSGSVKEIEKQVTVVKLNNNNSKSNLNEVKKESVLVSKTDLHLNLNNYKFETEQRNDFADKMVVQKSNVNVMNGQNSGSVGGVGSGSSIVNSGNTTVTELNVSHPSYLYYMMSSGQFSPCDTLDSGTGSDLESNGQTPSPKNMQANANCNGGGGGGGAPKLEMHLKTTKIRVSGKKSLDKIQQQHNNSNAEPHTARAGSLTDSEESESSSSLSCDSLHSNEFMRQSSISPNNISNSKNTIISTASSNIPKPPPPLSASIATMSTSAKMFKGSFLPDSLLREICDRKFPTDDFTSKYESGNDHTPATESPESMNEHDYIVQQHAKFLQERNSTNLSASKRASLPSKTFVLNAEDGTFIDTKMNSMPRKYEADKFYNFHVNEHENFRSFGNGGGGGGGEGSTTDDLESLSEYETKSLQDDAFAGYKDIRCGSATSTIRSSKGTVRGVKNRVRNGIATFLQLQQPNVKNYKEKDLGKVVLYTTSMGIIRDTYAKCSNVKQILRTLLVKFEERDVFMSVEYQQEIKERMHLEAIKVPQLFVEGQHIGDAETVERLNESGELRQLLKPYKSISTTYTCQTCGGYRLLPCPSCNGSKKSVHRNHFTAEFVALKCMNCDEVGLVKCHNC